MSLYLTRAEVPYDIVARPWRGGGFRDAYQWHQRVWECFPGDPGASRDFLSRLDDTGDGFRLLVLSSRSPSKPDWCPEAGWESKAVAESFLTHSRYPFSL